jgi:hypothetical protein
VVYGNSTATVTTLMRWLEIHPVTVSEACVAHFQSRNYHVFSSRECLCVVVSSSFPMMPILLVFFHVAFFYPVFPVVWDSFVSPIGFTFQCGFCVLIGLFVALDSGMPLNPHQNQMFIFSVDLVHHFHNLGVVNFFHFIQDCEKT